MPGKLYKAWEKASLKWIKQRRYEPWTGTYPVEISFFFFRDSMRRFDFDNTIQGSLDVLQQAKIIKQDDMVHVIPIISGWAVDKCKPRVVMKIAPASKQYFKVFKKEKDNGVKKINKNAKGRH